MKHLAAYALLVLSGKENPSKYLLNSLAEADIENLLKEVGIKTDKAQVKLLLESLKGKKFHEIVAEGMSKIQTVGAAAPAASSAGTENKGKKEAQEEKKEEKKEEEEDLAMGGIDIFGDDD